MLDSMFQRLRRRHAPWALLAVLALASGFGATTAQAKRGGFGFDDVVELAKARAGSPYEAPRQIPDFMQKLSMNEYRAIRFDSDQSLWRDGGARFEVQMIPAGAYYRRPVKINLVDADGAKPLMFRKEMFVVENESLARRIPANLGFAGFKLTYPLNRKSLREAVLTFAGATYFRGVGAGNETGLAARGLAIDTGLMSGEEFPQFVEYWLERPAKNSEAMRFYALMDSRRISGAYQFSVYPGAPTKVDVKAVLFTRERVELLGVAPLTSMFYYGENTSRPVGDWRPEVHASDGLLMQMGNDEWVWNPLLNPKALHVQAFSANAIKGFGLLQRDTRFESYEDSEVRFDQKPSAWVVPKASWGDGRIMLIEIPSKDESNDNIVAFWAPKGAMEGGQELALEYRISFGSPDVDKAAPPRAINTFVGRGEPLDEESAQRAYRLVVDFAGEALDKLTPEVLPVADVSAQENGEVIEQFLTYLEERKIWRLSILARPADGRPLALRAALTAEGKPVTETWTYTLPEPNSIYGAKR